jgi:hypothetical protein
VGESTLETETTSDISTNLDDIKLEVKNNTTNKNPDKPQKKALKTHQRKAKNLKSRNEMPLESFYDKKNKRGKKK